MEIMNYIDGEFRKVKTRSVGKAWETKDTTIQTAPKERRGSKPTPDSVVELQQRLEEPPSEIISDRWDLITAIESATTVQPKLKRVSPNTISKLLEVTMDSFFDDEDQYRYLAQITGSPLMFLKSAINETKDWVRDLDNFSRRAFSNKTSSYFSSESPTLAVLPNNSEQEALFVIAQAIMARSALVIRPSRMKASSYISIKFAEAWSNIIDRLPEKYNFLRKALNVVNFYDLDELWRTASIDSWNYVCFGSGDTIKEITETINGYARPRKIIGYGLGFSTTIIDKSTCESGKNIEDIAEEVLASSTVNSGNECTATDIAYIHEEIYDTLYEKLREKSQQFRSLDPLEPNSIGIVSSENTEFIVNTLTQMDKLKYLNTETLNNGQPAVHCSVVPLLRYESAKEFPGPILCVKAYSNKEDLVEQMNRELEINKTPKFLVATVYGSQLFLKNIIPRIKVCKIIHNKPSHIVDLYQPHQGINLLYELSDFTEIE